MERETDSYPGLTEAEARRRLAEHGPNLLHGPSNRGFLQIVRGTFREPMFLFLVVAAALYLVIGDIGQGLFMVLGASVSIGLVIIQETRSERALSALQSLAEPMATVVRAANLRRIPARDLVAGDVILVGEGERIPADSDLVAGDIVTVDESVLTGESIPLTKIPGRGVATAGGERIPGGGEPFWLFAGTLVVGGRGTAIVARTGGATALGKIGASLATIESEPTQLQRTSARLVGWLGVFAVISCAVVFLAYGLLRHDWIAGALSGITLAIALLPEEFPMVLAIFTALGAWRLARRQVLVRRGAVIETLGAATVLCVDKTGTLTENRMAVAEVWTSGQPQAVATALAASDQARELVSAAGLASNVAPVDPMDAAIRAVATGETAGVPVRMHPLRRECLAVFQVWQMEGGGYVIASKGAPEAIAEVCHMDGETRAELVAVADGMAKHGFRVLGVASCHSDRLPGDPLAESYRFHGLLGFLDPVRADVPEALADARRAGIKVAMITGDYPATALKIAADAGINTAAGVLTGPEMQGLDEGELGMKVRDICVFARIQPEQKLRLVEALKRNGEVVAMTGDGINDAPALEAADIGIAMGQRGTDVAREAADVVLLDDSFRSIISGVSLGRRIFANLRKALIYVTAVHLPTAALALAPILLGLPQILLPVHVILVELVIDPVCSLVFEAEPSEKGAMSRRPRPANESLFGRREVSLALVQGGVIATATLLLYVVSINVGVINSEARAMAFVALVCANLILAFADSAETGTSFFDARRIAFWSIGTVTATILGLILWVPALSQVFAIERPAPLALAVTLAVALAAGGWYGLLQRLGLIRR